MAKREVKVNLVLLKRLVSELETQVAVSEKIMEEKTSDNVQDYVVEMSKATGLAAGIVQEASMLVGDIAAAVRINTSASPSKDDGLASLLGILGGKGPGLAGDN